MQQQDYHSSIAADITPKEAFDKIVCVNEWWSTNFEGSSSKTCYKPVLMIEKNS